MIVTSNHFSYQNEIRFTITAETPHELTLLAVASNDRNPLVIRNGNNFHIDLVPKKKTAPRKKKSSKRK